MLDTVIGVHRNHRPVRLPRRVVWGFFATVLAVVPGAVSGCGGVLLGLTASLGGATAGGRGEVRVLFINNTPYRAVFTVGTYDPLDEFAAPEFSQFGLADDELTLPGDSESAIGAFPCARVFSIGGPRLLALIQANEPDAQLVVEASQGGVAFYDQSETGADPVSEGTIGAFEARLGTDFPCGALLIIRFEINDVGDDPFRIDFEIVPSESPR